MTRSYKRLILLLTLTLAGAGYFGACAQLDVYSGLKGYLAIVPIQIGALIYCFCIYPKRRFHPTDDDQLAQ